MMHALLLLLAAPQAAAVPTTPAAPPEDWSALPELRFRKRPDITPDLSDFVRGEVQAGRCTAAKSAAGVTLHIDLAVLVGPGGPVRRIVPRAINCPTVEQYASGLVSREARENLDAGPADADAWYRTSLDFTWRP